MSKECKDCEYFDGGWDYSDGTPHCSYEGGYEMCPYNDSAQVKQNGIKIEIDAGFMSDYIRHTLQNTAESMAHAIIEREISGIITQTYKETIKKATEQAIQAAVNKQVAEFMDGDITIGGGWVEPARTMKRSEYMQEIVQNELDERLKGSPLQEEIKSIVYRSIKDFSDKLKREVNQIAKLYLDDSIKQTLGESVVSILMGSQPYMQLSDRIKNLLPENKK